MSMSLDGFITGPDDGPGQGLGRGGERLHDWLGDRSGGPSEFRPSGPSAQIFDEVMATGSVLVGRRTFDIAGSDLVHYVTDGIESAMRQAKEAAGDANVLVHGAHLAQSCLRAGVLDELEIQLIPVLLGAGRPLFGELSEPAELELTRVVDAPGVTHLRYEVAA